MNLIFTFYELEERNQLSAHLVRDDHEKERDVPRKDKIFVGLKHRLSDRLSEV